MLKNIIESQNIDKKTVRRKNKTSRNVNFLCAIHSATVSNHSKSESDSPLFIIAIIIILLVAGCKGSQHLAVSERITHDTCYIRYLQYDSIYINNLHYIDCASDPIVINNKKTEF